MTQPTDSQISAGGVIVRRVRDHYEVCLILRTRYGKAWGLPKGHLEVGEDPSTTAIREVREETGLVGDILHPLGQLSYQFHDRARGVLCSKTVFFFLMVARGGRLEDHDAETVEARWMTLQEAMADLAHDNERRILQHAQRLLADPAVAARVAG